MPRVKYVSPSDALCTALRRLHVAEDMNDDDAKEEARRDLEVARVRLNVEFRQLESAYAAEVDGYVKRTIARYVLPHYVDLVALAFAFDTTNHTDAQLRAPGFTKKWTKAWLANRPEVAIEFWRKPNPQATEAAPRGGTNTPPTNGATTSTASPAEPPAAAAPELAAPARPSPKSTARRGASAKVTDKKPSTRARKTRGERSARRSRETATASLASAKGRA